jgi:hypothetical protein
VSDHQQLAVREATQIVQRGAFDAETRDLIKKTVSDPRNPLTSDEFDLFLAVCQHIGANPLLREAYALKDRGGRFSVAIGIDKFRQQTQADPRFLGQAGPYWAGKDGVWKDVWLEDHPPAAAKVGIWLRGASEPTWGVATYKASHRNTPQWTDNPAHMLAIRAEAHAHRKCSSRLSGPVVLREDDGDDRPAYVDQDGVIDDGHPSRARAIAASIDAAVAEAEASVRLEGEPQALDEGATPVEREPPPAGPRWANTPLGRQVSALVDALTEAKKKFSLPDDDASPEELKGWLASKKAVLGPGKP